MINTALGINNIKARPAFGDKKNPLKTRYLDTIKDDSQKLLQYLNGGKTVNINNKKLTVTERVNQAKENLKDIGSKFKYTF